MKILLSKTGYWRKDTFRVRTDLIESKNKVIVRKTALGEKSNLIIENIENIYQKLKNKLPKNVFLAKPGQRYGSSIDFEFCKGEMLEKKIEDELIRKDFDLSKQLFFKGADIITGLPSYKNKIGNEKQFVSFFKIDKKYLDWELDFINPSLDELTADHIICDDKKCFIIDYEIFLNFPIPKEFVLFRYQFHLLNTLQQVIGAIACSAFTMDFYLKDLFIPTIWQEKYKLNKNKKLLFLELEKKKQEYLNWEKNDYDRFKNYEEGTISVRTTPRLSRQQAEERLGSNFKENNLITELENKKQEIENYKRILSKIQSAKFYRLWQLYCKIRDDFFNLIKLK